MQKKTIKKNKAFAELLSARKITAYKLSGLLGFKDKTTAYKWIYGKAEPNAKTMLKLMEILGVSALEILNIFARKEDGKESNSNS